MNIKNNRGFSLIEVLVTMGLIGILTVIALPAYRNYRATANDTVLKADSGNAYKAMHAYNAVNGTFCGPSLDVLGLKALLESSTYTGKSDFFVGFAGTADSINCPYTSADYEKKSATSDITASGCTIGVDTFSLGVANKFAGNLTGFSVSNSNSAPAPAVSGSCSKSHANCQNRDACVATGKAADCQTADAGKPGGTWTPGAAIGTLCP